MKEIKMINTFIMPVKRVEGGVLPMLYDNQNQLIFVAEAEYVDAASIAINSHDKLTEQNKMLREALVTVDGILSGCSKPPLPARASILEIKKALEQSK